MCISVIFYCRMVNLGDTVIGLAATRPARHRSFQVGRLHGTRRLFVADLLGIVSQSCGRQMLRGGYPVYPTSCWYFYDARCGKFRLFPLLCPAPEVDVGPFWPLPNRLPNPNLLPVRFPGSIELLFRPERKPIASSSEDICGRRECPNQSSFKYSPLQIPFSLFSKSPKSAPNID